MKVYLYLSEKRSTLLSTALQIYSFCYFIMLIFALIYMEVAINGKRREYRCRAVNVQDNCISTLSNVIAISVNEEHTHLCVQSFFRAY